MDKLTLENTRDFALSTDGLKFMQDAYSMLEKLSAFGGLNFVVSGCEVTGSSAASGFIVLKGILMPFLGGTITTNVRIVKDVQTITVDNGSREQTTYHAEFGTSTNPGENVTWSTVKRLVDIPTIVSRLLAVETLSSGNAGRLTTLEYESNWHECTLLGGGDDLSSELLALKRKGNVVHYRIQFRFNKENPTTYPSWQLPDWAITSDQMYTSGKQHGCICLYEKQGSSNVNSLPASFYSEDSSSKPKQAAVSRGYAEGSLFGHTYTGNNFEHEGTFLV